MKPTKNKQIAVTSTQPPNIVPPPTKREILIATATALAEERREANKAILKRRSDAVNAMHAAVEKEARRMLKDAKAYIRHNWDHDYRCTFDISINASKIPALATLHKAVEEAESVALLKEDVKQILAEITPRLDVTARVNAILSHPDTKAALLEAGKRALNGVTAEDRRNAVEVGGGQ